MSLPGFSSASINFGLNVAAVGVTLPLSIDAANITAGTLGSARLPVASATTDGIVNQTTQTFAGLKTFSDFLTITKKAQPSLPIPVPAQGVIASYSFTLPSANTWHNVFETAFNGNDGTILVIGRIGAADQTNQNSFMLFFGKGANGSSPDFINIVQGSATHLRVNAGYLQMLSSWNDYGRGVHIYVLRIA